MTPAQRKRMEEVWELYKSTPRQHSLGLAFEFGYSFAVKDAQVLVDALKKIKGPMLRGEGFYRFETLVDDVLAEWEGEE